MKIVCISEHEYDDYQIFGYLIVPDGRDFDKDMAQVADKCIIKTWDALVSLGYVEYLMCEAHLNNDIIWNVR